MSTTTDTDERVDLDVDLDAQIPCQGRFHGDPPTPPPATWRCVTSHLDGSHCITLHLCDIDHAHDVAVLTLMEESTLRCHGHQRRVNLPEWSHL